MSKDATAALAPSEEAPPIDVTSSGASARGPCLPMAADVEKTGGCKTHTVEHSDSDGPTVWIGGTPNQRMGAGLDPVVAAPMHYRIGPMRPNSPRTTPADARDLSGSPSNGPRAYSKLVGTLLTMVTAAPVALAVWGFRGTSSSPKAKGRVLAPAPGHYYRVDPMRPQATPPDADARNISGTPSKEQRSTRLLGTLLAAVAAAPMALAMQALHGTASSPKAMGRVLLHIVLLAGVSGSGAQLVGSLADRSESATDASTGPPPPTSVDLDAFYSADVGKVAAFLGPEMHFHHGLASAEVNDLLGRSTTGGPAAAEGLLAERALADALRVLYPHLPLGSSVLDVGCGWCGPATLLAAERAASVRGLTISRAQAEFCRARRDVPTLHADAEETDVGQLLRMAPSSGDGEAPHGVLLPSLDFSAIDRRLGSLPQP